VGVFNALPRELTPEEDRAGAGEHLGPEGAGYDYTLAAAKQVEAGADEVRREGTLDATSSPCRGSAAAAAGSFNSGGGNAILSGQTKVTAPELAAQLNRELSSITSVRAIVSPEGGLQRGGRAAAAGRRRHQPADDRDRADYPEIARAMQPILRRRMTTRAWRGRAWTTSRPARAWR
jgi:multidrug efflux pump